MKVKVGVFYFSRYARYWTTFNWFSNRILFLHQEISFINIYTTLVCQTLIAILVIVPGKWLTKNYLYNGDNDKAIIACH